MPRARRPEDPRFSESVRGRFGDAVYAHNVDAVREAIAHPTRPIDVNVVLPSATQARETALFRTAGHHDLEVVELLLAAGADPHHLSAAKRTPMMVMAQAGNLLVLQRLHASGGRLHDPAWGVQPLHGAVRSGRLDTVRWLLDQNVPIDTVSELGRCALHEAMGYPEVARLLLERGADTGVLDLSGRTPLAYAQALMQAGNRSGMIDPGAIAVLERQALLADGGAGMDDPDIPRAARPRL